MPFGETIIHPFFNLSDRVVADPEAREHAKVELVKAQGSTEMLAIEARVTAIAAEAAAGDPWIRRARPNFLYVMYALLLWAIPMGLLAALSPQMALGIANGMSAYLRGIPEELYALFGTGYLGYTAARAWGKAKGVES